MTSTAENYQLKWHSHLSNLNSSVANLYKNDKYADVMLFTSNSEECFGIPAHKLILSTCSHYFSSLFENIQSSVNNSIIYIVLPPELSKRAIQILIQYMYSGEATVSNDILNEVLRGGEMLKIRGLCRNHSGETQHQNAGRLSEQQITTSQQEKNIRHDRNSIEKLSMPNETIKNNNHRISQESPVIVMSHQNQQSQIVLSNSSQHLQNFTAPPRSNNHNTPPAAVASSAPMPTNNPSIIIKKDVAIDPAAPTTTTATTNNGNNHNKSLESPPVSSHYGVVSLADAVKKAQQHNSNTTIQIAKKTTNSNKERYFDKGTYPYDKKKAILRQYPASRAPNTISPTTTTAAPNRNDDIVEEKLDCENTEESLNYLTIKEEPVEWTEIADVETITTKSEMEITIKPEVYSEENNTDDEDDMELEQIYSPLTCELCSETFMIPADWVRHIQGHSEVTHQNIPKKRQRYDDEEVENTAALRCDLCSTYFITPGEWVRHVQNTHTETELAMSNNSAKFGKKYPRSQQRPVDSQKSCSVCNKIFPSYASMVIHKRTHTGERPFNCNLCKKGFNVKSNLLRHMRTLHNLYQQTPNLSRTNISNDHESSDTD